MTTGRNTLKVIKLVQDAIDYKREGLSHAELIQNINYLAEQSGMSFTGALKFSEALNQILKNKTAADLNIETIMPELKEALIKSR